MTEWTVDLTPLFDAEFHPRLGIELKPTPQYATETFSLTLEKQIFEKKRT